MKQRKQLSTPTLAVENIVNKTMYSVQELHLCLFSYLAEVISTSLVSSIFPVHSSVEMRSTSLFTKMFLHSQFL